MADVIIEYLKSHGREVNWRNYFALNFWDENYRPEGEELAELPEEIQAEYLRDQILPINRGRARGKK
jgi:hypothetical protein